MTASIQAALLDHKPALLAWLGGLASPDSGPRVADRPASLPARPAPHGDDVATRSSIAWKTDLARAHAPREGDALRRYRLRVDSPIWPEDADDDDYRLAARLAMLHARGARAYLMEWGAEDQALADRVMSRNGKP
jgi:hypothetical protein